MSTDLHDEKTAGAAAAGTPSVEVACPHCEMVSLVRVAPTQEAAPGQSRWACPACGWVAATPGPAPEPERLVERCWVCSSDRFYLQKDFNRQLGLAIVFLSAGLVFLVMLLIDHRLGVVLLLAVALVDWFVYRMLATVTVCYLCHSIYRGLPVNEAHGGFYLETEEEHKKLRRKWIEEEGS